MTLEISCLSRSFSVLKASHSSPRNLFCSRLLVALGGSLLFDKEEEGTLGEGLLGDDLLGVNGALVGLVGRNGLRGLDLARSNKLSLAGLAVDVSLSKSFVLSLEDTWLMSGPCCRDLACSLSDVGLEGLILSNKLAPALLLVSRDSKSMRPRPSVNFTKVTKVTKVTRKSTDVGRILLSLCHNTNGNFMVSWSPSVAVVCPPKSHQSFPSKNNLLK